MTHKTKPASCSLAGAKVFLCALLSARVKEPEQIFAAMEAAVRAGGGACVGRLLQRRGISRSSRSKTRGVVKMELPLTQRSLFGRGKLEELIAQAQSAQADLLLVYNSLTNGQRKSLAELVTGRVVSFQNDLCYRLRGLNHE